MQYIYLDGCLRAWSPNYLFWHGYKLPTKNTTNTRDKGEKHPIRLKMPKTKVFVVHSKYSEVKIKIRKKE